MSDDERLLAWYRQVLGHDLPNILLAVQGMLRLLELDEGDRLGERGHEYLRRLAAATGRAQGVVRLLAELGQAGRDPEPAGPVALDELVAEAAAEIKQLFPGREIEYHLTLLAPTLTGPRRALRRALVQLLRYVVQD